MIIGLGVLQLVGYIVCCLLVIALHLFLLLSAYLVYIHSKYDHLPGPKRSRYALRLDIIQVCFMKS